tara:strand:- start:826 stop:1047 length:222 start_codon:yes stop_codon:yes gene_type:complete
MVQQETAMLAIDQKVTLNCTDTGRDAPGTIVRIVGDRVDVMLDGGANILVSLRKSKPGLYVGSQSGLEFVMKL